jgi:hypothetical protein
MQAVSVPYDLWLDVLAIFKDDAWKTRLWFFAREPHLGRGIVVRQFVNACLYGRCE